MRIALFTDCVSPHQLPLANEIVKRVGACNYLYVYTGGLTDSRLKLGWGLPTPPQWSQKFSVESRKKLEGVDFLYSEIRDIELFEKRASEKLRSAYVSERWFKPICIKFLSLSIRLPGSIRLLVPRYYRMAKRFVRLYDTGLLTYWAHGVHAAADMARIYNIMHGQFKYLLRRPAVCCEDEPMGTIDGFPWMKIWGYFVARSCLLTSSRAKQYTSQQPMQVLWVGRLIALKRVDTVIKAVSLCQREFPVVLTIIGNGPERIKLERLAKRLTSSKTKGSIIFVDSVPIQKVREHMRENDLYIFSSNALDGWGAVVSEALTEGMSVVGSVDAGSSATLLPTNTQFKSGDYKALSRIITGMHDGYITPRNRIGNWTPSFAADKIMEMVPDR